MTAPDVIFDLHAPETNAPCAHLWGSVGQLESAPAVIHACKRLRLNRAAMCVGPCVCSCGAQAHWEQLVICRFTPSSGRQCGSIVTGMTETKLRDRVNGKTWRYVTSDPCGHPVRVADGRKAALAGQEEIEREQVERLVKERPPRGR